MVVEPVAAFEPVGSILKWISISTGSLIETCPLKAAFGTDERSQPLEIRSLPAVLGSICHKLLEVGPKVAPEANEADFRDALELTWSNLVDTELRTLEDRSQFGGVPEPTKWPEYQRRRIGTVSTLLRQRTYSSERKSADAVAPQVEKWLEDPALRIRGRVDRIEKTSHGWRIVDIKTGARAGDSISDSQRHQLHIYAYLWSRETGEWPAEIAIRTAGGQMLMEPVDHLLAEQLAQALYQRLEEFNALVNSGNPFPANPTSEACRNCFYRPSCRPFLDAVDVEWAWFRPTISLHVTGCRDLGDHHEIQGRILKTSTSLNMNGDEVTLITPRAVAIAEGQQVAIGDLSRTRNSTSLLAEWDTRLAILPNS
jgi:RecB family exonuclease